jgi:outer membrane protein TolC
MRNEPALSEASAPAEWWQLFSDATLTTLQAEAAETNLDLQAAITRIEESRAQMGLVDAARWPQISAGAAYSRQALSQQSQLAMLGAPTDASSVWLLGLQASWELDLWGHLRRLSESAEARLQATTYGMGVVRVLVAGDVARTYLLLRGVQAQMTIVEENRQIAENLVHLAESRQRNGVATRFDTAAAGGRRGRDRLLGGNKAAPSVSASEFARLADAGGKRQKEPTEQAGAAIQ